MAPRQRSSSKAADSVSVEPASAAEPRKSTVTKKEQEAAVAKSAEFLQQQEAEPEVSLRATTPSKAEVNSALEQSAEYLEQQAQEPEAHPRPTTPSKSEVDSAIKHSEEFLQAQNVETDVASAETRDKGVDAAPVSAGGTDAALSAGAVYAGRDKSADAGPVFYGPVPDKPAD